MSMMPGMTISWRQTKTLPAGAGRAAGVANERDAGDQPRRFRRNSAPRRIARAQRRRIVLAAADFVMRLVLISSGPAAIAISPSSMLGRHFFCLLAA
jgi:hypothetical protein